MLVVGAFVVIVLGLVAAILLGDKDRWRAGLPPTTPDHYQSIGAS